MDLANILELIKENPGSYFIAGLMVGFFLRGYLAYYRVKRPGRYEALELKGGRRMPQKVAPNEPCFEWADAAVKKLTAKQSDLPIAQHSNES